MARREPRIQSIKGENISFGKRSLPFFLILQTVEGEKGRENKTQNFSLRSTEFRQLEFIVLRTKVHLLDEGYVWVPKTWDFAEGSIEEFGKSKVLGVGSVHGTS